VLFLLFFFLFLAGSSVIQMPPGCWGVCTLQPQSVLTFTLLRGGLGSALRGSFWYVEASPVAPYRKLGSAFSSTTGDLGKVLKLLTCAISFELMQPSWRMSLSWCSWTVPMGFSLTCVLQ
jgi:hypothetical protein